MKAALSHAAGRIAPNTFETAPRTCIECGAPLESWQTSRCQACIDKSLIEVVVAHSAEWLAQGSLKRINAHATAVRARYQANAAQVAQWNAPNPIAFQTCDGIVLCADCSFRGTSDCDKYQDDLTEAGRDNDDTPAFWTVQTAEIAGAYVPREG